MLTLTCRLGAKEQRHLVEDPDEYAVYSTVLKARYSGEGVRRYVIALETNSVTKNALIGYRSGLAPRGAERPEVDPETSKDFDSKTKDACGLANKFILAVPYSLVSEEALRKILDNQRTASLIKKAGFSSTRNIRGHREPFHLRV